MGLFKKKIGLYRLRILVYLLSKMWLSANLSGCKNRLQSHFYNRHMAVVVSRRVVLGFALWCAACVPLGATDIFKCVVNGTLTFQGSPCAVPGPVHRPTAEELNASRKKAAADNQVRPASNPTNTGPVTAARNPPKDSPQTSVFPTQSGFRCDGRQYCSQMRSCSEAKYFLARCAGVKLDGNRDGVPCEQQWCTHPLAD